DWWASHGQSVSLVTLDELPADGRPHPLAATLDSRVERVPLDCSLPTSKIGAIMSLVRRVRLLRRHVCTWKPDVVVSFETETNVIGILATMATSVPIIVCEQVDP